MVQFSWHLWLAVVALLLASATPTLADDATLDLDAIIKGINGSDVADSEELGREVHQRPHANPPAPKSMVEWPDAEVVNARKGEWLLAHVRQPPIGRPDRVLDHWMLWRGGTFTDRYGDNSILTGTDPKQMGSYFWYPNTLMRDGLVDLLGVPKLAYLVDTELSFMLPWCLQANKAAYRVRKQLEDIDGALCHVVERPDHDVMWIDAGHGFQVRRRTLYQKSGPLSEFRATDFRERIPGVWLPTRQVAVAYNFDSDPPEYRGRLRFVMTNTLSETRFGELPDDLFTVPEPKKR